MEEIKCEQVGMLSGGKWDKLHDISRRVYSADGLAPTVHTAGGGQQELKIVEPICLNPKVDGKQPNLTDRVYDTDGVSVCVTTSPFFMGNIAEPVAYDEQNGYLRNDGCVGTLTTDENSPKHNNRVVEPTIWGSLQKNCAKKKDGICPTLTSAMGDGGGQIPIHNYDYRIRKLTERECGRLMGVKESDFERVAQHQSTSSLYHLAGDSIVTTCLMAILGELFGFDYNTKIKELIIMLSGEETNK